MKKRVVLTTVLTFMQAGIALAGGGRQPSIASVMRSLGDHASLHCSRPGGQISATLIPIEQGRLDRWALVWGTGRTSALEYPPLALTSANGIPVDALLAAQAETQRYGDSIQVIFDSPAVQPRCLIGHSVLPETILTAREAMRHLEGPEQLDDCLSKFGRPAPHLPARAWLVVRGPRDWVLTYGAEQLVCDARSTQMTESHPVSVAVRNRLHWEEFSSSFDQRRAGFVSAFEELQARIDALLAQHRANGSDPDLAQRIGYMMTMKSTFVHASNQQLMTFLLTWLREER